MMLEKYTLDHFEFTFKDKIIKLPNHITGTLSLFIDKIDLWIHESPFNKEIFEVIKYLNNYKSMFIVEANSEEGNRVKLEKCALYRWGENIPGTASKQDKSATITGIGIQSLEVKWYY